MSIGATSRLTSLYKGPLPKKEKLGLLKRIFSMNIPHEELKQKIEEILEIKCNNHYMTQIIYTVYDNKSDIDELELESFLSGLLKQDIEFDNIGPNIGAIIDYLCFFLKEITSKETAPKPDESIDSELNYKLATAIFLRVNRALKKTQEVKINPNDNRFQYILSIVKDDKVIQDFIEKITQFELDENHDIFNHRWFNSHGREKTLIELMTIILTHKANKCLERKEALESSNKFIYNPQETHTSFLAKLLTMILIWLGYNQHNHNNTKKAKATDTPILQHKNQTRHPITPDTPRLKA